MAVGVRLRLVVRGVSPPIVRTVEVPGSVSLVELHEILLVCFGWSGEHLHVFEARGRSYSASGYVDAQRSSGGDGRIVGFTGRSSRRIMRRRYRI